MAAKFNYTDLIDDNVQFLQGTQAQLNLYLPNAPTTIPEGMENAGSNNTFKGRASEGAFYLTTDTHRLYVGRKVSAPPDPNPHNVKVNDVYPEEVSTGIATVANSGELANVQTGGAAHDGDFYYIKEGNILAVYEENASGGGGWQQINSPTGINEFNASVASAAPTGDNLPNNETGYGSSAEFVRIRESILPDGSQVATSSDFWLKAGDNVTLKTSSNSKVIEISSANSQSTLSVEDTTAATNKAPVVLSDNINLDTKVYFVGKNDTTAVASYNYIASTDTTVNSQKTYYTRSGSSPNFTYAVVVSPTGNPSTSNYYERENIVTIAGPGVDGTSINSRGTAGHDDTPSGFNFNIQVTNGETGISDNKNLSTESILDPTITIGEGSNIDTKFHGGKAILDVYSTGEVDTKISNSITSALQNIDALHYKGTVANATAASALDDNGTVEIGDVYKASGDFLLNGIQIKTGDLLIANGTETNGKIAANQVTWEIVPSGDEPVLQGIIRQGDRDATIGAGFGLEDVHIAASYGDLSNAGEKLAKRPLYVSINNASSTLIHAETSATKTTADDFEITLHHMTPNPQNYDSATLSTSPVAVTVDGTTNVDSIGSSADAGVKFQAIKAITRDSCGHVTKVEGQEVTLKHNYLTSLTASHSATNNIGTIRIGATDTFGISDSAQKGVVKIGSQTLAISAAGTSDQLNINLQWKSF